jgi:hypothetical protein
MGDGNKLVNTSLDESHSGAINPWHTFPIPDGFSDQIRKSLLVLGVFSKTLVEGEYVVPPLGAFIALLSFREEEYALEI